MNKKLLYMLFCVAVLVAWPVSFCYVEEKKGATGEVSLQKRKSTAGKLYRDALRALAEDNRQLAIKLLEKLLNVDESSAEARALLAMEYFKEGELGPAYQVALENLDYAKESSGVLLLLAKIELARGEKQNALAHIRAACELEPDNPELIAFLERLEDNRTGDSGASREKTSGERQSTGGLEVKKEKQFCGGQEFSAGDDEKTDTWKEGEDISTNVGGRAEENERLDAGVEKAIETQDTDYALKIIPLISSGLEELKPEVERIHGYFLNERESLKTDLRDGMEVYEKWYSDLCRDGNAGEPYILELAEKRKNEIMQEVKDSHQRRSEGLRNEMKKLKEVWHARRNRLSRLRQGFLYTCDRVVRAVDEVLERIAEDDAMIERMHSMDLLIPELLGEIEREKREGTGK